MISQTHSVITKDVTKKQLWKLISNVNNWKKWDTSVEYSELQGEFKTGSFFTLKPVGVSKVKIQLADVRPESYFKDCTVFPLAKMYGEHTYEETSEGLKITVTMSMSGPLAFLWNRLVMKDIVSHLPQDIDQHIKAAQKL